MDEKKPKDFALEFFNENAHSYDTIVNWMTLGKDDCWKKKILQHLSNEKTVLDLACGTGILTRLVSEKIPHAKIIGVDMSKNYLIKARERSGVYQNISFVKEDAENLNLGQKFDCITASYLPKYCNPDILIQTCLEHLNDGGKIVFHDFTYPASKVLQKFWIIYLKTLLLTSLFIPHWKNALENLPCLIKESKWVENYSEVMKNFGLKTQTEFLTWGSSAIVIGHKPV